MKKASTSATVKRPVSKDGRPILQFRTRAAFKNWIQRNGRKSDGIWIKFAKKGSGVTSITYQEALDVSLCFGWIDSQVAGVDHRFYLQRFTPRRAGSIWSKINCGKVEKLNESGEMTPEGLKHVDAAKADGRWERAYLGASKIETPQDFKALLDGNTQAKTFFDGLSATNRYAILFRLHHAKKPETRRRRMEQFIEMLEQGKAIH